MVDVLLVVAVFASIIGIAAWVGVSLAKWVMR
jgi:hypothetical protein